MFVCNKLAMASVSLWSRSILQTGTLGRCLSSLPQTNDRINAFVHNRNPRNLERLRLAKKPTGYYLEKKKVDYWHKILVLQSSRYVTAQMVHNNGTKVVEASTTEWCIRKYLYKPSDRSAFLNLARVFAERCLESGINECYCDLEYESGTKLDIFIKTVEAEGLTLREGAYYDVNRWRCETLEKKPWLVYEE